MPKKLNYAKRLDQGREWLQNMDAEFHREAEEALSRWIAGKRVAELDDDEEADADENPELSDAIEAIEQLENLAHWRGAKAAIALADGDLEEGWESARQYWLEIALVAKANARAEIEGDGPRSFYFRMAIADKAIAGLLATGEAKAAHWLAEHLLHYHRGAFAGGLGQEHALTAFGSFAICLERASRGDWDGVRRLRDSGAPLGPYAGVLDAWREPEALRRALATALDWHVQQTLAEREFDEGFYDIWPVELQAILRVRRDLGLETPLPEHQLLASPLWAGGPPASPLDPFSDKLFAAVEAKLLPLEFDEESLALIEGKPIDFEFEEEEEDDEEYEEEGDDDGEESIMRMVLRRSEESERSAAARLMRDDDEEEEGDEEDEENEDDGDDEEDDGDDEEDDGFEDSDDDGEGESDGFDDGEEDDEEYEYEDDEEEEEPVPVPQTIEEFEALLLQLAAAGDDCSDAALDAVSDYKACFVVDWKESAESVIGHVEDQLPIGAVAWEYLDEEETKARFERNGRVAEAVVVDTEEERQSLEEMIAELDAEESEWEEESDDDEAVEPDDEEVGEDDEEEETEQPPAGRIYRTLIAMRDVIRPEYDIKAFYGWAGYWPDPDRRIGSDTQVFALLPSTWWNRFAELHPDAMNQLFVSLDDAYMR